MSRVTLHRRGITRVALLAALVDQATQDYRERMWPVLTTRDPAPERLARALEVLCDAAEEHMTLLLALRAQSDGVFHEEAAEDAMTRSAFIDPLRHLIEEGIGEGAVEPGDPARAATLLFNLVGWTYIHMRSGHGWAAGATRSAVVDLALRGILRDGA